MRTFAAALVAIVVTATTFTAQFVDTRRLITVTGEAETHLVPDRAILSIGVQTEGLDVAQIKAAHDKRTRSIVDAVRALGITTNDIQTDRLTIEPVYDYKDGRQELLRYRMYNVVTIRIKDLSKVEMVVNAGIAKGSNVLNGLIFESSKEQVVRDSLRIEATKDARRKASDIAQAAGANVGRVATLSENAAYNPTYERRTYMKAMSSAADVGTPVEGGELTIRCTINAVFELE